MLQQNQSKKNNKQLYLAEIIQSSLQTFTAQSWQWDSFPTFGSLVAVNAHDKIIFGLVYAIQTGSLDPYRTAFAYKKTEEELRIEQPQIFEYMHTTFFCLIVGFLKHDVVFYQIAPEPPKMHAFVRLATPDEMERFFKSCAYLHIILKTNIQIQVDELLISLLQTQAEHKLLSLESCIAFIETIQLIVGEDYRRLKILIDRSESILSKV